LKQGRNMGFPDDDGRSFSTKKSSAITLNPASFSLRKKITELIQPLLLSALTRGLEISCRVWPEAPDTLVGDSDCLDRVLGCLLRNALAYTGEGQVFVRVTLEEKTGKDVILKFAVADTGQGLAPEEAQSLREEMNRASGMTGRSLIQAAGLAKLMGGQLNFESEPGEGSTFFFTARFEHDLKPVEKIYPDVGFSAPPDDVLDEVSLLERVDNNPELLEELVILFNESLPGNLEDLNRTIADKDGEALSRAAHSLKGVLAHFSARKSYWLAALLEMMGGQNDFISAGDVFQILKEEIPRLQTVLAAVIAELEKG